MIPVYAAKLGLEVLTTNVKAQKICNSTLKLFKMVLATIQIQKKLKKTRFFKKPFLIANTSVAITLSMLFLIFSNIEILFVENGVI